MPANLSVRNFQLMGWQQTTGKTFDGIELIGEVTVLGNIFQGFFFGNNRN